jgi:hypothetical protein
MSPFSFSLALFLLAPISFSDILTDMRTVLLSQLEEDSSYTDRYEDSIVIPEYSSYAIRYCMRTML